MHEIDDMLLLRQYAETNSSEVFERIVKRHLNLVYSAALRHVGDSHQAEEITQVVFIILARKAARLHKNTILSGWLYQTTRLTAANFLRTQARRARREQEAFMQSSLNESEPDVWPQIAPLLDSAMGQLSEKDRNAIVLRYFEGRSLQEVGTAFGTSENAAKKRVHRALEKLRTFFGKRGIALTTAMISGAVSANSIQAAPLGLAFSASVAATGAALNTSTLTLIKGTLTLMAWTKTKTAIVSSIALLLLAGSIGTPIWCYAPIKVGKVSYSTPMSPENLILVRAGSTDWEASHLRGVTDYVGKLGSNLKVESFTRTQHFSKSRFLPIPQSGAVPYHVEVTFLDQKDERYTAIFTGAIEYESHGLLSPKALKALVDGEVDSFIFTVFEKSPQALKVVLPSAS